MGRDFTVYMLINGSTGNYLGENFLEKKTTMTGLRFARH